MQGQIELWKIRKSGILPFYQFFKFFDFLVESEVKKIILVKFSLRKARFNPREVIIQELLSNQCYYLLIWFFMSISLAQRKWKAGGTYCYTIQFNQRLISYF